MNSKVLIIDDEKDICFLISEMLCSGKIFDKFFFTIFCVLVNVRFTVSVRLSVRVIVSVLVSVRVELVLGSGLGLDLGAGGESVLMRVAGVPAPTGQVSIASCQKARVSLGLRSQSYSYP